MDLEEADVEIVDSHVHFWDLAQIRYPWLGSHPKLSGAHGPAEYEAARSGVAVSSAVFVECDAEPTMSGAEVAFALELVDRSWGPSRPGDLSSTPIGAIVARAPLELGDGVKDTIVRLAAMPLVRGVRRILQDEDDRRYCLRDGFVAGVRALAEADLSMDLCIRHHQLPGVIELARRCEDVRFVLDHAGKPDIRGRSLDPWRADLRELASLDHVSCKLSGLVTEADPTGWTADDLRPYVEHVIDCFGFDRVLFGGDWPVVDLAGGFVGWFDALTELVSGCSQDERARLWGTNARAFYRMADSPH